ncbi:hypothetical protein APE_0969.1 [Aeropyrum pernix K1]|uniref:Uncharacterized protein n=1 Tax=Aeropyrum pernix (strain ATCC 700893 / DSM 11879 / JCM 9820 / NBRC 100138 / K1) TaxID=272557 RepID=Q9YDE4_AERPE|nr:hypothetical protein [Aeropyrum pernix]BAA79953.2 hypothetical protein APE_0969.1 [Aeropyrum pernix K1]
MARPGLAVLLASLFIVPLLLSAASLASPGGVIVAVDVSHGQGTEGLDTIVSSCAGCTWVLILADESQEANITPDILDLFQEKRYGGLTPENLSDVDVLLIGQATSLLSNDEVSAIASWGSQGKKAVWVAGDSDYPAQGSETAQQVVNQVLEALNSNIRIDYVSVEDDESNAERSYRVVGIVDPEGVFSFLKEGLPNGGKVLFHGPGGLFVIGTDGAPANPVKEPEKKPENVYVIVRTTENSRSVQHQDPSNGGLPAVLYDPLSDFYNTGPFPLMMAEVKDNVLIFASSETMYGGYEPMTAPEYYGVQLDGPQFVAKVIATMVGFTQGTFIVVEKVITQTETVTETVTKTQTETTTKTETATVTETVTQTTTVTETNTAVIAAAVIIILAALGAAFFLLRR